MQHMVFVMQLRWLAASTITVELYEICTGDFWNKLREKKFHLVGPYPENSDCYFKYVVQAKVGEKGDLQERLNVSTHYAAIRTEQLYMFTRSFVNLLLFNFNSTKQSTVLLK